MLKAVKSHLLQNKANSKESIFEYPLIAAIEDGEVEIVRWLLEHNDVQINRRERGTIALIAAVKGESKEVFKLILKQAGKENAKQHKILNSQSSAGCG